MDKNPLYWLFWTAPQWEVAADVATTAGVLLALGAGIVAYVSYRAGKRSADNAHMHGLFRDYLRTRFDYQVAADTGHASEGLEAEVASIKLYVLEEMWLWVHRQRGKIDRVPLVRSLPVLRRRHEVLDAWSNTVINHVVIDLDEVILNVEQNTECYDLKFLDYLAETLGEPFEAMRIHQRDQAAQGRRSAYKPHESPILEAAVPSAD